MRATFTALWIAFAAAGLAAQEPKPKAPKQDDPPAAKQADAKKDEAKKDEAKKDNAKKDDAKKDDAKKDDAEKNDTKKDSAKKDDAKKDDAKKNDAKKDSAKKTTETPAEELPTDFAGLQARWKELKNQLDDVADKYRKAFSSSDRQKIFSEEYLPLQGQADRLLPKLRDAAAKQYAEAPGDDPEVTELVVGFAADAVRRDDYELALKLGKLLRDNGCENPAVHYVLGMSAHATQDFDLAEAELKKAEEARLLGPREAPLLDELADLKKHWEAEQAIREKEAEADDLPRVKLTTSHGDVVIELFENEAPQAVANFIHLVKEKFYDGLTFHRVLGNFMAQGGCPEGTGSGGPGYEIYCECHQENFRRHFRGSLSMAHAGRDTGGSQFFLTFRPTPTLDGRHTVFGRVVEGWDVLPKIQRRNPDQRGQPEPDKILRAEVIRDRGHEYKPTKVGDAAAAPPPAPSKSGSEDKNGADKSGADKSGADKSGADKAGSEKNGADKAGSEKKK